MSEGEMIRWCDFCGKNEQYVDFLIASPNSKIHICDECIKVCRDVLLSKEQKANVTDKSGPREK